MKMQSQVETSPLWISWQMRVRPQKWEIRLSSNPLVMRLHNGFRFQSALYCLPKVRAGKSGKKYPWNGLKDHPDTSIARYGYDHLSKSNASRGC
jgi:hypothetical protein